MMTSWQPPVRTSHAHQAAAGPPKEKRKSLLFVILGGGGLLFGCCVFGSIALYFGSQQAEKYEPLKAACEGSPVPGAAAYVAGPGHHPLVMFDTTLARYSLDLNSVPNSWQPEGVADAQLVLCLGARNEERIERCGYDSRILDGDNTIERYRYRYPVKLVVAQTGAVLLEDTLWGSMPEECPEEAEFSRGDDTETIYGGTVGEDEVSAFAVGYVNGSAPRPAAVVPPGNARPSK